MADGWQGLGIARQLLGKLACHAQAAGVERLVGETLAGNGAMLHLARRAGFRLTPDPDLRDIVRLERVLPSGQSRTPCGAAVA